MEVHTQYTPFQTLESSTDRGCEHCVLHSFFVLDPHGFGLIVNILSVAKTKQSDARWNCYLCNNILTEGCHALTPH